MNDRKGPRSSVHRIVLSVLDSLFKIEPYGPFQFNLRWIPWLTERLPPPDRMCIGREDPDSQSVWDLDWPTDLQLEEKGGLETMRRRHWRSSRKSAMLSLNRLQLSDPPTRPSSSQMSDPTLPICLACSPRMGGQVGGGMLPGLAELPGLGVLQGTGSWVGEVDVQWDGGVVEVG